MKASCTDSWQLSLSFSLFYLLLLAAAVRLDAGLALVQSSSLFVRAKRNRGNFCLINDIGFSIFPRPGCIETRSTPAPGILLVHRLRPPHGRKYPVVNGYDPTDRGIHLLYLEPP